MRPTILDADRGDGRDEAEPGAGHARCRTAPDGALIGAVVAVLLLLIPAGVHGLRLFAVERGLEVVAIVLLLHAAAMHFWNYALHTAAVAAVLILVDLPQPSHYADEGYRVLWTLCGVGIGLLVMVLAGLLAKRTAKASPRPA
ncbi:hypothetical protein [Streptomyces sp. NPDC057253]|uniref:hypothetical protein n=1 Tax=Streptomyces sp. NPDC057253 TaxID=3346069 RepID=UPI0036265B8F